jgi:uncharacterized membrane protein YheB (UPF0754 family)
MNIIQLNILRFALPPIIGAAIGYITNSIAIKMLFRPLVEKRVLGLRLPFTPGIIPRQRGNLASSIAEMVSSKLLTEDAIRLQLKSEGFENNVYNAVSSFTGALLEASPGDVDSRDIESFVRGLEDVLQTMLEKFVKTHGFDNVVDSLISRFTSQVMSLQVERLFSSSQSPGQLILQLMERLLSDQNSSKLLDGLSDYFEEQIKNNGELSSLLSDDILIEIQSLLQYVYDPALTLLLNWLNLKETRVELSIRGRFIVRDILDKLNFIQRFFISAAQYDRVLDEKMPEIIDSLLENLEEAGKDPKNRENVVNVVVDGLRGMQSRGIGELGASSGIEPAEIVERIKQMLRKILEKKEVQQRILHGVQSLVEKNGKKTLGELSNTLLNIDESKIITYVSGIVKNWLQKPDTSEILSRRIGTMVLSFFNRISDRPLKELLVLSPEKKQQLDRFLSAKVLGLVDRQLPRIVHTFDVHSLVINKINSLDMENVEKLLLMVIARHLKWINIFGAILGALIGTIQIIVNSVT